jgi:hypothetical protein
MQLADGTGLRFTGCFSVSSFVVRCPASNVNEIDVDAGSLDDTVDIVFGVTVTTFVTGGTGPTSWLVTNFHTYADRAEAMSAWRCR